MQSAPGQMQQQLCSRRGNPLQSLAKSSRPWGRRNERSLNLPCGPSLQTMVARWPMSPVDAPCLSLLGTLQSLGSSHAADEGSAKGCVRRLTVGGKIVAAGGGRVRFRQGERRESLRRQSQTPIYDPSEVEVQPSQIPIPDPDPDQLAGFIGCRRLA